MAYRTAPAPDRERDRDRYRFERERFAQSGDFSDDDTSDLYPPRRGPPVRDRERDRSSRPGSRERRSVVYDREEREEDEVLVRERERTRRVVYDREEEEEPPRGVRRRPASPPPAPPAEVERERVVIERERYRSPSPGPAPPPRLVRRQSSLDTFDRKPAARRYWERDGPPPPRREEGRMPPYVDIPLPRARALPPPRVYAERDEVRVSSSSHLQRYEDDGFPPYPERVREREVVTTRRRSRSRSKARGRSRSSSSSSSSSDAGGTVLMPRDEYPKKGKTRIPARLVSKRALIELSYPYVEEGNTVIVQKALGQSNIDELLKLSSKYKKTELEVVTARSSAPAIIEERIEHRTEVYEGAAALHVPPRSPSPGFGPRIIEAAPPQDTTFVEQRTTVIRDPSPARTYLTYDTSPTYDSYDSSPTIVLDARSAREVSGRVPVGPLALAEPHHHHHGHHHRHRRVSSTTAVEDAELRSEIRHLEKQLARRERSRHRRHRSLSTGGELVRAERLSTGELVLYEEEVETLREPSRGRGVRVERDKRGRMSIVVNKYR